MKVLGIAADDARWWWDVGAANHQLAGVQSKAAAVRDVAVVHGFAFGGCDAAQFMS